LNKNLRFEYLADTNVNTIEIELTENTNEITVIGTKIVPEFGVLSLMVLGMAVTSLIVVQKSKNSMKF
jgi:predicted secreted protein with PEFG-CTERM motif